MSEDTRLSKLTLDVYGCLSDNVLDTLSEDDITGEELTSAIRKGIEDSIEDNYKYFKSQYDKMKALRNAFVTKDQASSGTLEVETDTITGEMYLTLPDEVLEKVHWNYGDRLEWVYQGGDSYILRKYEPEQSNEDG